MTDDGSDIQPIDTSGIPDLAETAGELFQFDDVPTFDKKTDPEIDTVLRLKQDLSYRRIPTRRLFVDYRSNPDAYRHLDPLPAAGESLHGVISGKYCLWELVPAILEITKGRIADLHIATLSYNKQNATDILSLLDDKHIQRVSLLISYYFKSTSADLYGMLVPQLKEREMRVLAMRTHIKLLLIRMADGTKYVVESSANLRSSVNLEGFVMTNDPGLYDFHYGWIENELLHGKELGSK